MSLNRQFGVNVADAPDFAATEAHICTNDPVMSRFRAALMEIQSRELSRLYKRLPQLDAYSREAIEQSATCMVEMVLRPPAKSLQDEPANYYELRKALERLFQLDD
jgi:glutamyl-tRNA reductase